MMYLSEGKKIISIQLEHKVCINTLTEDTVAVVRWHRRRRC